MSDYDAGPWAICQRSGFKVRLSDIVTEWSGLRVYRRFADKRNPQDFLKAVKDDQAVKGALPEAPDTFLTAPVLASDL